MAHSARADGDDPNMRIQLLSDLHLESEVFKPQAVPGAELLVLAGDIDSRWDAYTRFAGWPVPVVVVPGNHEFDGRNVRTAVVDFERHCTSLGFRWLHRRTLDLVDRKGRTIRFMGATRWSDFDVFGPKEREKTLKVGTYFQRVMRASWDQEPFDVERVRALGLEDRAWLAESLGSDRSGVDATVVVTHFAPSLRSADPRYGSQLSTAAFCNADDALVEQADLWLHGHVHCRHDYRLGAARVVCQARGLADKGEVEGYDTNHVIDI